MDMILSRHDTTAVDAQITPLTQSSWQSQPSRASCRPLARCSAGRSDRLIGAHAGKTRRRGRPNAGGVPALLQRDFVVHGPNQRWVAMTTCPERGVRSSLRCSRCRETLDPFGLGQCQSPGHAEACRSGRRVPRVIVNQVLSMG